MEKSILKNTANIPAELYGERKADKQLAKIIEDMGRPGYVLVSRQMGKTNLLLNAKRNLQTEFRRFVYIDCSIGFIDSKNFFRYIVDLIIDTNKNRVGSASSKIFYSRKNSNLIPPLEFEKELIEILRIFPGELVLVLDEIDALTKFEFCDDIFTQIRSSYFNRVNYNELERLTYILSGVAEPSQLIKDKNKSPFNIGAPIYLSNFSYDELVSFILKIKLPFSTAVIKRIYYWSAGHPRITWDLCFELEQLMLQHLNKSQVTPTDVNSTVDKLYFEHIPRPPIDSIKTKIQQSPFLLESCKNVLQKNSKFTQKQINSLFLAGIISNKADRSNYKFANKIIETAISKRFIENCEKYQPETYFNLAKKAFKKYDHIAQKTNIYKHQPMHLERILNKLFINNHVNERPNYLNSTLWQRRRSYSPNSKNITAIDLIDSNKTFSSKSNVYSAIGPYEQKVLGKIIFSDDGYLIFRGNARSGKSSLMSFIERVCNNSRSKTNESGNGIRNINLDKDAGNIAIVKIDAAHFDPYIDDLFEANAYEIENSIDKFFRSLFEMTLAVCQHQFQGKAIFEDAFYNLYKKLDIHKLPGDIFSSVIKKINSYISLPDENNWNSFDPLTKHKEVRKAFNALRELSGDQLFVGIIAPLWYIANRNGELNVRINSLIFIIDNTDPYPTLLQTRLVETIRKVCSSETYKTYFNANSLRIVLPVRVPTFKRRHGYQSLNVMDHQSFYTSDLIRFILVKFFLTKELYYKNSEIPIESQDFIFFKLYMLWANLADRGSYFCQMFDAISGSNIIHAFNLVKRWFLTDDFPPENLPDNIHASMFDSVKSEIVDNFLINLWKDIVSALKFYLQHGYPIHNSKVDLYKQDMLALEIADNFATSLGIMFMDHRITCYPCIDAKNGYHFIVMSYIKDALIKRLSNGLNSVDEDILLKNQIIELKLYFENLTKSMAYPQNFISKFISALNKKLHSTIYSQSLKRYGFDPGLGELFANWINISFSLAIVEQSNNNSRFRFNEFNWLLYDKKFAEYIPPFSRFNACSKLLHRKGGEPKIIENVLYLNSKQPKPVSLHILYILYYSSNYSMPIASLAELLKYYGYSFTREIVPTLQNLAGINRQLIFFEDNDYRSNFKNILKQPELMIFLSQSGKGYLEDLIITPVYLQWCFDDVNSAPVSNRLNDRINSQISYLQESINAEIHSLKILRNTVENNEDLLMIIPDYLCATLDLLVRSTEVIIKGLIAHYKNLPKTSGESKKTIKILFDFLRTNRDLVEQVSSIFFKSHSIAQEHKQIIKWSSKLAWNDKLVRDVID